VSTYPEALEEVYKELGEDDGAVCNLASLRQLHETYAPFGEYYELVVKGAEEMKKRDALYLWLRLGYAYCKDVTSFEARRMPIPPSDGSAAGDMFAVLLLAAELPLAVERYRARGFDEEQIANNLGNLARNIWVHQITVGSLTLSQGLYGWMTHYTKAIIFDHKGLNYQPAVWEPDSLVLKNRKSGEFVIVMIKGRFHRDGLVLGSAGATDEEGAFNADFSEQMEAFFGRPVRNGRVQNRVCCFDKKEWYAVLRPGDDVLNLHIPRKTNFDPAVVEESLREGWELTKRYYPELSIKAFKCCSWMLDPSVARILGENSKIGSFSARFTVKHPVMDAAGTGCMGYVWPGETCPTEELPEKTTLQRGIKALMLAGDTLRWTTGVITKDLG